MPFAVAAAGSLAGGLASGIGASEAGDAAAAVAREQLAFQKQIYNEAQGNLNPYIQFGQGQIGPYGTALSTYQNAIPGYFGTVNQYQGAVNQYPALQQAYQQAMGQYGGAVGQYANALPAMTTPYGMQQYQQSPLYTPMVTNLAELQATPGYQFQLQQGLQAINNSAAAQGGLLSGATQQALNNYAQNQAATGFQNAWQRAQNAYGNAFTQNLQGQQQLGNALTQQANLYNIGVGQSGNAAGLGQNYAALVGQTPGLYAGGMGLYNTNVQNLGTAAQVGQNAASQLAGIGQSPAITNAYNNLGSANAMSAGGIGAGLGQAFSGLTNIAGTYAGKQLDKTGSLPFFG